MRFFLIGFLFCAALIFQARGQAPQGINYQGVARDSNGKPLISQDISVRITILKDGSSGDTEFAEIHTVKTNSFGLFMLVIGHGKATSGSFEFISWAIGNKWLQIELDPAGGNSFQLMGSQQLMSVPYAFYSTYSGNGLTAGQGIKIQNSQVINTGDADSNPANETITDFTLENKKLKLTEAGVTKEVDLSSMTAAQNLSEVLTSGNNAGGQKITNLATPNATTDAATKQYVDNHSDADNNASNEIQDLTKTGNTLSLSGDGSTVDLTPYLDNTDSQSLSLTGNTINLTSSPTSIDLSSFLDNTDNQDLSLTGNTLSLTNDASPINLSPYLDNTDNQDLTLTGNTLGLANDATTVNLAPYLQTLTYAGATNTLSISGGNNVAITTTLNQVLSTSTDANAHTIANLAAPTNNNDAATKKYVDDADALLSSRISTTYAFKTAFSYSNTSGSVVNDQQLPFTTEEFDDFNILSGSTFTASENGTYVFMVEGSYFTAAVGQLSLFYNSVKYSVALVVPWGATIPKFNATFMFKLTTGQTVRLIGDNVPINGQFSGNFYGYKL